MQSHESFQVGLKSIVTGLALLAPFTNIVEASENLNALPPIIGHHCGTCHAPTGLAFDLTDPQKAYDFRFAIADAVSQGRMPPRMAAPGHRRYERDISLTPAEKQVFEDWRNAGFPREALSNEGKHTAPNIAAPFKAPLQIDVTNSHNYLPDQSANDDYRCFVVDWPLKQDRFVTGIGYNGFVRVERAPGTKVRFKHTAKARSPAMTWPLSILS